MEAFNTQFMEQAGQWSNTILVWIGFGTVVGLLAKAIMPGRDPGGAIATLAMGVGGTVIGCGVLSYFHGDHISPISPLGFLVGTGGAFILLAFYRLFAGRFFIEGETRRLVMRPRSKRRSSTAEYVDVHY